MKKVYISKILLWCLYVFWGFNCIKQIMLYINIPMRYRLYYIIHPRYHLEAFVIPTIFTEIFLCMYNKKNRYYSSIEMIIGLGLGILYIILWIDCIIKS